MASLKVPHPVPSPTEDAESLRKAFEGWGTNEKSIISILAHRDAAQRMQIRKAYEELYQQDLIKRMESELTGHMEKAMYRWMFGPAEREAILVFTEVRKANPTPDPRVIIEIACVSSPEELLAVKKVYQSCYKHSLEEDVAVRFTGDIRKLLVALVGTYRYDGGEIDIRLAHAEGKTLHDAIHEKAFGHEEVIRILTTRSKAQLNATFNCYKDEYGTTINKSLPADSENEFFLALRATIRSLTSPCKYFEKLLRNAIINQRTNENTVTRVIVTRAEKDLQEIKEVYYKRNNVPLAHAVAKENEFFLALRATIRSLTSPCKYFEKLLRNAIINQRTDENTVTRVIVTRAEKDLQEIKEVYYKRNNVPLAHAVAKETSGDYKAFLLALLGD